MPSSPGGRRTSGWVAAGETDPSSDRRSPAQGQLGHLTGSEGEKHKCTGQDAGEPTGQLWTGGVLCTPESRQSRRWPPHCRRTTSRGSEASPVLGKARRPAVTQKRRMSWADSQQRAPAYHHL